jgi:hypothetical protein
MYCDKNYIIVTEMPKDELLVNIQKSIEKNKAEELAAKKRQEEYEKQKKLKAKRRIEKNKQRNFKMRKKGRIILLLEYNKH